MGEGEAGCDTASNGRCDCLLVLTRPRLMEAITQDTFIILTAKGFVLML